MKKIFLFWLFPMAVFAQNFAEEIIKHREEYKADFLKYGNSPLKKEDLEFLKFYEPNEKFKVECTFKPIKGGEPFKMPTSSGKLKDYLKFGELHFKIDGKNYKLAVYKSLGLVVSTYEDYLFVPFKDLTNGKETYGGGRYNDLLKTDIKKGKIWLDFNKCYNPYCAFSAGYSCPIPPKENHLNLEILAGEMNFGKEH